MKLFDRKPWPDNDRRKKRGAMLITLVCLTGISLGSVAIWQLMKD